MCVRNGEFASFHLFKLLIISGLGLSTGLGICQGVKKSTINTNEGPKSDFAALPFFLSLFPGIMLFFSPAGRPERGINRFPSIFRKYDLKLVFPGRDQKLISYLTLILVATRKRVRKRIKKKRKMEPILSNLSTDLCVIFILNTM